MFSNNENVLAYATRISKTPEGILAIALSVLYLIAFLFFATLSDILTQYGISINREYRAGFLLMPFLLLVVLLRMDLTARSAGDRWLTVLAIVVAGSVPIYRLIFF